MNYTIQAICTNGVAAVLLFSLILNYVRKHHERRRENILFLTMLSINLALCVVETATIVIDGMTFPGARVLAIILNAFLFINNILFALHWTLYADAKVGADQIGDRKKRMIKIVPALLIMLAAVTNLFYPIFFKITDENIYVRQWPFAIAYVVTCYYLILGTAVVCKHRKQTEKYNFLPVFTFLMPVFAASAIQLIFPGISLLWAGAAIGLTSAYMSLLDESSLTDKLSGLYSRHYLNQFLDTLQFRIKDDSKRILGMMIDIDDFKKINDTHGHLVGDDAIVSAAKILKVAINSEKTVFRFAGDEFVVIMPIQSDKEIAKAVAKIHNMTEHFNLNVDKPYDLYFSIGYTLYAPGEKPNDFIERMDSEMYREKRRKNKDAR